MDGSALTGFVALPAELRLKVYDYVVTYTLARGNPTYLARFFLSCRTVYEDIELEYMKDIRFLLLAQRTWMKSYGKPPGVIGFTVFHSRAAEYSGLHIDISIHPLKEWRRDCNRLERHASWFQLITCLQPILVTEASVLSLAIDYTGDGIANYYLSARLYEILFCYQTLDHNRLILGCLRRLDRLVMIRELEEYDDRGEDESKALALKQLEIFAFNRMRYHRCSHVSTCHPCVQRGWIAKVWIGDQESWRIVLKFGADMDSPEGALWELCIMDSMDVIRDLSDANGEFVQISPDKFSLTMYMDYLRKVKGNSRA